MNLHGALAHRGHSVMPAGEIAALHARLEEAEDTLAALRNGAADALLGETGVLYLSSAEKPYVTFFSAMNEGGVTLDGTGTILYCNPRFAAMMGRPAPTLRGQSLLSCVIAADRPQIAAFLASDGAGTCEVMLAAERPGGWPAQLSLTPLDVAQRRFGCLVVTDLTERMMAEHELERLVEKRTGELRLAASILENTREGVMVTAMDSTILSVNPAFSDITGYTAAEAIGAKPALLRSQRHAPAFYEQLWQALRRDGRWQGEIWNRRKTGEVYLQWSTINLVPAQAGQPACYVSVFTDVTEFWRREERIAHLAYHDPLTNLPNRALLLDRLNHALSVAERHGDRLGVLYIDLDGFKAVNDNLGHPMGDRLLQEIASRLGACVRSSDTVARLGGDEFVVLMEQLDTPQDCASLAEKLTKSLAWQGMAGERPLQVGASVGIAVHPDDGRDAATLLQHADAALYAAKNAGKSTYRFFEHAMRPLGVETRFSCP